MSFIKKTFKALFKFVRNDNTENNTTTNTNDSGATINAEIPVPVSSDDASEEKNSLLTEVIVTPNTNDSKVDPVSMKKEEQAPNKYLDAVNQGINGLFSIDSNLEIPRVDLGNSVDLQNLSVEIPERSLERENVGLAEINPNEERILEDCCAEDEITADDKDVQEIKEVREKIVRFVDEDISTEKKLDSNAPLSGDCILRLSHLGNNLKPAFTGWKLDSSSENDEAISENQELDGPEDIVLEPLSDIPSANIEETIIEPSGTNYTVLNQTIEISEIIRRHDKKPMKIPVEYGYKYVVTEIEHGNLISRYAYDYTENTRRYTVQTDKENRPASSERDEDSSSTASEYSYLTSLLPDENLTDTPESDLESEPRNSTNNNRNQNAERVITYDPNINYDIDRRLCMSTPISESFSDSGNEDIESYSTTEDIVEGESEFADTSDYEQNSESDADFEFEKIVKKGMFDESKGISVTKLKTKRNESELPSVTNITNYSCSDEWLERLESEGSGTDEWLKRIEAEDEESDQSSDATNTNYSGSDLLLEGLDVEENESNRSEQFNDTTNTDYSGSDPTESSFDRFRASSKRTSDYKSDAVKRKRVDTIDRTCETPEPPSYFTNHNFSMINSQLKPIVKTASNSYSSIRKANLANLTKSGNRPKRNLSEDQIPPQDGQNSTDSAQNRNKKSSDKNMESFFEKRLSPDDQESKRRRFRF